jgi:hypothetical protein
MFKHFSDNISENSGKYLNWFEIRSSLFCEQEDKQVRVHE